MTLTLVDSFTGTDGDAINTTTWKVLFQGTPTSSGIFQNQARLTGAANYSKASLQTVKSNYARGEITVDFKISSGDINEISLGWGDGYDAAYLLSPVNGLSIIVRSGGAIELHQTASESATILSQINLNAANYVLGDVVHLALRIKADGVDAWYWRNSNPRPAAPTLTSTSTTYANALGYIRPSFQTGANVGEVLFDNIYYDDLVAAVVTYPKASTVTSSADFVLSNGATVANNQISLNSTGPVALSSNLLSLVNDSFKIKLAYGTGGGFVFRVESAVNSYVDFYISSAYGNYFRSVINGGASNETTSAYVSEPWLRFRHDGTNILWESSQDNVTWTVKRSMAAPFNMGEVKIRLSGIDGTASQVHTVSDFNAGSSTTTDSRNHVRMNGVLSLAKDKTMFNGAVILSQV